MVNAELKEHTEEEYDEFLDECYGEVVIGCITFSPSTVLRECDPIAYRCGLTDYDSMCPVWVCGECGTEYPEDEDEAEECCSSDVTMEE